MMRAATSLLGEEDEATVRAAYPGPTWDRLRELKRRYDLLLVSAAPLTCAGNHSHYGERRLGSDLGY
jgi:hypothetical protein